MSDKYYSEANETAALRSWVTWQLLRGAGWAMLFVFTVGIVLYAIWGFSHLLDHRSKEMPSPYGQLEIAPPTSAVI